MSLIFGCNGMTGASRGDDRTIEENLGATAGIIWEEQTTVVLLGDGLA